MKSNIFLVFRKVILSLIRFYQITISPDHGLWSYKHPHGYCKFSPTCSQYAYQAIENWGIIVGGGKAIKRIIRCNPFSRGGYDPIKLEENDT